MVPEAVRQFFQNYRDAFVRFDGADVVASYHAPSIMARRDAYQAAGKVLHRAEGGELTWWLHIRL